MRRASRRYKRQSLHNAPRDGQESANAESDRLRPLFLAWVGKRSNAEGLREAGIPYNSGTAWLSGRAPLAAEYHARAAIVVYKI